MLKSDVLRTPDERFANLPGFPYAPNYASVPNPEDAATPLRMHYIDEGPRDAEVLLCLHGEPMWSYLYRKMIPVFADAGYRVVAPDHIGFGRSDKLTQKTSYTFERHIEWIRALVVGLDLRNINFFGQDWGGPIGLGVLAREEGEGRFLRAVAANTILHTVEPELAGRLAFDNHGVDGPNVQVGEALLDWILYSQRAPDFDASLSASGATQRDMPPDVARAYDAPVPRRALQAGDASVPRADSRYAQRRGRRDQPRDLGGAAPLRSAVPDLVRRQRPGNRWLGRDLPGANPRRKRAASRDARQHRSLPAGRLRRRGRAEGRRLDGADFRMKDARFGHGFWPYIVPYMSFVLLAQFSDRFPESWALSLLWIKPAVPALLIAFFYSRGMYPELRGFGKYARGIPLDIAVGLGSALLWVAPYLLLPESLGDVLGDWWPDRSEGFDPSAYGAANVGVAIGLRMFGYACVTPFFEELFIRSFVMRFAAVYDKGRDFRDVPVAAYTASGLWISTAFFTIGHVFWEWWVAVPWVVLTSLYFYRRGHIGSVILVHATANASILIAAVIAEGPLWFFV